MKIIPITKDNHMQLDDLVYWRETGTERAASAVYPSPAVCAALDDPNLRVFGAEMDGRLVGWIALVYQPKVGKWQGHGHIYVDELWVQPEYRRQGIAKALLAQADLWKEEAGAHGIRLYVNTENPTAKALYEKVGFRADGTAFFMGK